MSLKNLVAVDCPDCGQQQDVLVWDSLNVQVSPEAKSDFFAGKINQFECSFCHSQARLAVPFLYHDMALRFCVQYYPVDALDESLLGSLKPDGSSSADPFGPLSAASETVEAMQYVLHPHIVFSMQETLNYVVFREKLAAFYQGKAR